MFERPVEIIFSEFSIPWNWKFQATEEGRIIMRIGIAADHGGLELKVYLL